MLELLAPEGQIVCLIKPQFEAGREKVGKKGVVKDPAVHQEVIEKVIAYALDLGFCVQGLTWSPVKGPEGNIEYLLWLGHGLKEPAQTQQETDTQAVVAGSHEELDR